MRLDSDFLSVEEVKREGLYDVSDTAFLYEWWPDCVVYLRNGQLRMKHPEKNVELSLKGIKGWYFKKKDYVW